MVYIHGVKYISKEKTPSSFKHVFFLHVKSYRSFKRTFYRVKRTPVGSFNSLPIHFVTHNSSRLWTTIVAVDLSLISFECWQLNDCRCTLKFLCLTMLTRSVDHFVDPTKIHSSCKFEFCIKYEDMQFVEKVEFTNLDTKQKASRF